ncbi:hypothetical protein [Leuconostoc gelidum]|uniref:hypothetical protein n=1 Tax=Leuconostoc gelidum TaxID=1244 RepID=UPI001C7DC4AF|nr:hypothetical protein [Leuconostoc gelidum]MBZ6009769.1 hypothetical protein [Leuconostoc gelidum subsp. aenigmaticum]
MHRKYIAVTGLLTLIILFAGLFNLLTSLNHKQTTQLINETSQIQKVVQQNKNQQMQVFASKQPNVSAATTQLDKLFNLDWTLSDQSAFDARAKAMTPFVTEDVVKNSLDFKPDPDKTMTQTGVSMTYDHMDFLPVSASNEEVTAKVVVFAKSRLKDAPEATTRYVYDVSYNPKNNKITKLDRLGNYQLQSDSSVL